MKGVRQKESYNSWSGRRREKNELRDRETESWGKYVKSSKEERLTERDKLQRQTEMAFRELISSPPPSTAQLMAWQ